LERRRRKGRRQQEERRKGFIRVSKWSSVCRKLKNKMYR
jgi:hypothetical protein